MAGRVATQYAGAGTSFFTFTPGGCLLQTSSDAGTRPAHGAWVKTADREYDYTWTRPLLDAAGTLSGIRTGRWHLRLADSLDAWATTGGSTDVDLNGNIVGTSQSSQQGTKLKVEPMP